MKVFREITEDTKEKWLPKDMSLLQKKMADRIFEAHAITVPYSSGEMERVPANLIRMARRILDFTGELTREFYNETFDDKNASKVKGWVRDMRRHCTNIVHNLNSEAANMSWAQRSCLGIIDKMDKITEKLLYSSFGANRDWGRDGYAMDRI